MFSGLLTRLSVFLLVSLILAGVVFNAPAAADILTQRSVTLSSATPSAVTSHNFQFTVPSTANIGSLVFEYCSNSPLFVFACTPPAGLNVSSANLVSQSGNAGFSLDNAETTANKIVLSRPSSAGAMIPSGYLFDNITNPSSAGQTIYVRLSTYPTLNGSGSYTDNGAVAFANESIFNVGAYVPPFLKLCVGITVAPDCSAFTGDSIDLGDLSSTQARAGQSQFATATNDPSGYVIFALGTTMTSGNNTIPALSGPAPSFPGTGQFGINLRANLIPAIGQDPVGFGTGVPAANYNIPNQFVYNDGDTIASSPLTTDYNRMTVSYVVNVPNKQAAGIYATTITYVATVSF
jgi:hypothetical protein